MPTLQKDFSTGNGNGFSGSSEESDSTRCHLTTFLNITFLMWQETRLKCRNAGIQNAGMLNAGIKKNIDCTTLQTLQTLQTW
jgi:hypothetical protein